MIHINDTNIYEAGKLKVIEVVGIYEGLEINFDIIYNTINKTSQIIGVYKVNNNLDPLLKEKMKKFEKNKKDICEFVLNTNHVRLLLIF